MSNSLRPHGLQHTRPPCPPPTLEAYSNSCPLSRWCHPTISSSVVPFSSCPQSFPASRSFQMSQLFPSDGQSTGVSVLPMNIQDWYPLGWTGWISLLSNGLSRVFSNATFQNNQFFGAQPSSTHIHTWLMGKNYITLTRRTFVGKVMSLLFNMLSRLVIVFFFFFPKEQASFNFMAAVTVCSNFATICDPMDPRNSLSQNTVVGNPSLLQGIFPTQRSNQVSHIAGRLFTSWATREAQEYWSGLPIPSPVDLPNPGIEPGSPALQADSLPIGESNLLYSVDWFKCYSQPESPSETYLEIIFN